MGAEPMSKVAKPIAWADHENNVVEEWWLERHEEQRPAFPIPLYPGAGALIGKRKPLSKDEIMELADVYLYSHGSNYAIEKFARAIERRHGVGGYE